MNYFGFSLNRIIYSKANLTKSSHVFVSSKFLLFVETTFQEHSQNCELIHELFEEKWYQTEMTVPYQCFPSLDEMGKYDHSHVEC